VHIERFYRAALISVLIFAGSPLEAAESEVVIDNFTFTPGELKVKEGTTVIFRNRDDIPHTIANTDGEFHSAALDTDETFSFTFTKPGVYNYFCSLHPRMMGRVVVTP